MIRKVKIISVAESIARRKLENILIKEHLQNLKAQGHIPYNFNCKCCYDCKKCGKTLLDDGRLEYNIPCPGWRVEVKCSECHQIKRIDYVKKKPKEK